MIVKVQGAAELQSGIYYEYETDSIPLGQGGMGTVYQGYCFREEDRSQYVPVAIKKIAYTTKELVDKAMREASIQIENDNLLRMYGFIPNLEVGSNSQAPTVQYYVVMENLQGVNLDCLLNGQLIDKFGRECEFARQIYSLYSTNRDEFVTFVMSNVLNGVNALHKAGFIHRDLDPSNIMVTHDDKIKVIDFGISKKLQSTPFDGAKGTVSGSMMGKVDYAAPEMITGDVANHNYTTDIYALGIMAYQLYVGSLPFNGDSSSVAKDQINTPVPVKNISNSVIRHLVSKATRKEQSARYQSIDEIIEDYNKLTADANLQKYENEFHKLNEYTNAEKLEKFLTEYPDGAHTEAVTQMLSAKRESEAYDALVDKLQHNNPQRFTHDDLSALEAFLEQYPAGKHAKKVSKWRSSLTNKPFPAWPWIVLPIMGLAAGVLTNILLP
jgi:serine/threonine protein kinase